MSRNKAHPSVEHLTLLTQVSSEPSETSGASFRTFGQIVALIAEPVLTVDADGIVRDLNQRAQQRFGLQPDQTVGSTLVALLRAGNAATVQDALAAALAQPGTLIATELRLSGLSADAPSQPIHILALQEAPIALLIGRTAAEPDAAERWQPERMNQLLRSLNQSLEIEQVAQDALTGSVELLGAHAGCLLLSGTAGRAPTWLTTDGRATPPPTVLLATLASAASGQQYYAVSDTLAEPDAFTHLLPGRAALTIMLRAHQTTVGVLRLVYREPSAFEQTQQTAIEAVAEAVALSLHNAQIYSQLRDADAARDRMTNMLVHDIRSPLMATHASIEIARRAIQDLAVHPFVNESLDSGLRSVRNVIDLTNDLLDVKRLQSGPPTLSYRAVELGALIAEVQHQMQILASERDVLIRVDVEPPVLEIQADQRLLRRVLVNLVANAIRFTPQRSTITISVTVIGQRVRLMVDDQGRGVAVEDRERIFLPFVQGLGESHRGSGLGLALCREVVVSHQGRIWVEDRPGGGSRFVVIMPLAPQPEET